MQADVLALPCMTEAPTGTVFDLWSAHANSGATDESQVCPSTALEPLSEKHADASMATSICHPVRHD